MVEIVIKPNSNIKGAIVFEIPNDLLTGDVTEDDIKEIKQLTQKMFKDIDEIVRLIRESRGEI